MKRIYLALMAVLGLFVLAACGSSGSSADSGGASSPTAGGDTSSSTVSSAPASSTPASSAPVSAPAALPTAPGSVKFGSAGFDENVLLAHLYGNAMAAKGVKVTYQDRIGERGIYMTALKDGDIGAIPEYTGSIVAYFNPKTTTKTPDEVDAELQKLAHKQGLTALNYAPAQDSDTITVTKNTATKDHLKSIADLKDVAKDLTLGAPAQFKTRADGVPALKSVYGVEFGRFTATDAAGTVTVDSLKNGSIDAADIFSTDPSIAKNGLVPLTDPKSMFAAQNVVPLFSPKVLTKPMKDACDAVSAKLDTKTLAGLVAKVADGGDPDAVAKAWVKSAGLS